MKKILFGTANIAIWISGKLAFVWIIDYKAYLPKESQTINAMPVFSSK